MEILFVINTYTGYIELEIENLDAEVRDKIKYYRWNN